MKRTIQNCSYAKRMVRRGLGEPSVAGDKCMGYQRGENDDEPCETCKECKLNEWHESEVE